jgi:hypothetical protein
VAVPQAHLPGAEAEVDFGEVHATVAGVLVKLWLFVMRLSCSGRAFHVAFAAQAQEAFLEGHVLALAHFGAVPARVRYDNLKPAVVRVLRGRDRDEPERFTALRSHSLLTELSALSSQFTRQITGQATTVSARVRRREARPRSCGPERPAGRRAGRDRQPLGALSAA